MAEKKFSEFTEATDPAITDILVGLTAGDNKKMQIQNVTKKVQLDAGGGYAYSAGQVSYGAVTKTALVDTGFTGVRVNVGQESHVRFFNNTGVQIDNGTPLYTNGINSANDVVTGAPTDASSPFSSLAFIGLATANVAIGEIGLATKFGEVRGVDTSLLIEGGPLYLSEVEGELTNTRPKYPATVYLIGTVVKSDADGIVQVDSNSFARNTASQSYSFTSAGVGAGLYWKAGFYDWAATSVALTQASATQTHGIAGLARAAHVGIVPSAAGVVVGGGQVGLRVTGIKDDESGVQMAGEIGIITDDITTLTVDVMAECSEKFSGQVTLELYVVSGTPSTYSLTFNYGFSKYDDLENRDFTITGFECIWDGRANPTDTAFDLALMKHTTTGWTYAATGFEAGNGDICRKTVDQALAGDVANEEPGSYKRIDLNEFIDGNGSEGFIVQIITGQNNTIQTMDIHVSALSEELTR